VKVLIVNKFAHVTGGADKHCLDLARLLRRRGHDVAFVSTADSGNVEREGVFVPCTVSSRNRDSLGSADQLRAAAGALWGRRAFSATTDLIRRFRPDVVHAHKLYPQLSVAPLVAARRLGVPAVQTVHDYEFVSASAFDATGGAVDRLESGSKARGLNSATFTVRRTIHRRLVTRWIAVSRFVARGLAVRGIDSIVLPNFAEEQAVADVRRTGIVFAGRLSREKGIDDVIALARSLTMVEVRVAGDGPARGAVERAGRELRNLSYLGRVAPEAMPTFLAAGAVCVMPAGWEEPGALTALEAMAVGTPVVAYGRGGLAEYLADAGAGIVVDPNVGELQHACERILADRALADRLSAAGRFAIETEHSGRLYAERIEKVYDDARGCPACS
jgi:glycosyltransferase involved in cell wall biosynthesis